MGCTESLVSAALLVFIFFFPFQAFNILWCPASHLGEGWIAMPAQRWGGCSALQSLPEHTETAPAPSPRHSIDIQASPQTSEPFLGLQMRGTEAPEDILSEEQCTEESV